MNFAITTDESTTAMGRQLLPKVMLLNALTILTLMCTSTFGDDEVSIEHEAVDVDFAEHVAPLLTKNCVACHNAKKAEGGLNLETYEALLKGGDSGTTVIAGDGSTSLLLMRMLDTEDPMPPQDNAVGALPLTPVELAQVQAWIKNGALAPRLANSLDAMDWQQLAPFFQPINSIAASRDGNLLALGRGNQALIIERPYSTKSTHEYALVDNRIAVSPTGDSHSQDNQAAADFDVIQSIAFSPDNTRLAIGGFRTVKIWRRKLEATRSLETGIISTQYSLNLLSPDGKYLARSVDGKMPEFIRLDTKQSVRFLDHPPQSLVAAAWLDDQTFVGCGEQGGLFLTTMEPPQTTVVAIDQAVSVNQIVRIASRQLLGLGKDGAIYQIDIHVDLGTAQVRKIDGFENACRIDRSVTGKILVGFESGTCKLVDPSGFAILRELATGSPVRCVAMSEDEKYVVTSDTTGVPRVWQVETGAIVATLEQDYELSQQIAAAERAVNRQQALLGRLENRKDEFKAAVDVENAAVAKVQEARDKAAADLMAKDTELKTAEQAFHDAQMAVVQAETAAVEAMKLVEARKAELDAKQKVVAEVAIVKDKAAIELANRDQALLAARDTLETLSAKLPAVDEKIQGETGLLELTKKKLEAFANDAQVVPSVKQIAFCNNDASVAVSDTQGTIRLFTSDTGKPVINLHSSAAIEYMTTDMSGGLFTANQKGQLQTWNANANWELERVIGSFETSPFSDRVTAIDFDPNGKYLAVGSGPPSRYGEIKIIDLDSGAIVRDFGEVHSDSVLTLKYSPDGRMLASGAADKQCRIFDPHTGTQLTTLEGHTHHVLSLAWNDDSVTLATGSSDTSIKIWNAESAVQLKTIGGSAKEVSGLSYVANTQNLIAVDLGGAVRLIDVNQGGQTRGYGGAGAAVLSVTTSPDGKHIYAGAMNGTFSIWQTDDGVKVK